jgi:hypothetical protein
MVRDHLGYPDGRQMMTDFYARHLTKHLMKDEHYSEIQANDPVVTAYFRSANLLSGKSMFKHVNGKKYYKISLELLCNSTLSF